MKKLSFLVAVVLFSISTFAVEILPKEKQAKIYAADILIPIGKTGKTISLAELATIKIKDLQKLTGEKIRFADRIMIKAGQNKLRKSIKQDGSLNTKIFQKYLTKKRSQGAGFHLGGFALGLLLGLIGVLIAYLIKDDLKSNRVKWAWIGWGVWVIIVLLTFLA